MSQYTVYHQYWLTLGLVTGNLYQLIRNLTNHFHDGTLWLTPKEDQVKEE